MMWGYNFDWGSMLLMSFGSLLWMALLVVLVWAVSRWLERKTTRPVPPTSGTLSGSSSELEILRQRYARGEIDTAIYEQMRERLVAAVARENHPLTVHR